MMECVKQLVLVRIAWVILMSVCAGSSARAQRQEILLPGYMVRLWEAADGLPDQTAQAFAQTQDGNLWIGTKGGLLSFDGVHFFAYGRNVAPAALERGVNCLLAARDGSLWIGTEGGGVVRLHDGIFRSLSTASGTPNEFVRALHEDLRGVVWIGGDQGLYRAVSGDRLEHIDGRGRVPAVFVRSIVEDRNGHIWVSGTSLLEFSSNSLLREIPLPGGPSRNLVTSLCQTVDGTLWAGTVSGLYRITALGRFERAEDIPAQVSVIRQTGDGTLWIGTVSRGIYYRRGGKLVHISTANLENRTVNTVFEDRERNIWLGIQSGVLRLSQAPVSVVPFPGGADSEFETLFYDRDGSIWVAASTHLFRIRNGAAQLWAIPGLRSARVRTLMRDRGGSLWIGTDGAGLSHLTPHGLQRYDTHNSFTNDFVRTILEARDGTIWAGTDGGLSHIVGERIDNYSTQNGLSYFSITSLLEDRKGGLWVGTSRGLNHLVNGRFMHDHATTVLQQEQLWSIAEDAAGAIWFGTSNGLYRWNNGALAHLARAEGLADDRVYQILDDRRGNTWLVGPNSISRLASDSLTHFQPGGRVVLNYHIDSHDLNSASLYSGMQPGGAVAPNGDVWLPSNKGALHIEVARIVQESTAAVQIAQVTAFGQTLALDREIVLRSGNARLEITYNAVRLRSQENLRYRYEMEGLESWNEVYGRRTAYYPHLPAGRYRFRVQVYAIDNPAAVSEASIVIVQRPHFYATAWFIFGSVLAMLALGVLIYRLRLRQMSIRFHAVAEERSRLAREIHDTVIQDCVGVSALLEAALGVEASDEPVRERLLSYATCQMRETIEKAREAVWALRNNSAAETDPGTACTALARQFQGEFGLTVDVRVRGAVFRLEKPAMHELMRSVREALANIVAHAAATHAWIDVEFAEHHLAVEIGDDGRGFQPHETSASGHFGIVGMHERVRLLRGHLQIDTAPGQGTRVRIRIPRKQRMEKVQ